MKNPFISFIVTARNDDYGGNWVNRINAFLKVLIYQTNRLAMPCELVFVEYNPPFDKKHIYDELTIKENKFLRVRFITVPYEFHKKLPDSEKTTVCEFIGKNIGMRRALGEWFVCTNPDVLYGNDLFDFFASGKPDKKTFYRINRKDLSLNKINPDIPAEKILKTAERKTTKIMYSGRTVYLSWKEWFWTFIHGRKWRIFLQCPLFNDLRGNVSDKNIMHANAAGDFLLLHRDAAETIRGYDQKTVGSGVLDGYILYVLYCFGYKQSVLPYSLFHIYHHHKGVKYLASHIKFKEDAKIMLETKIPYKTNPPDWGFPAETFGEVVK